MLIESYFIKYFTNARALSFFKRADVWDSFKRTYVLLLNTFRFVDSSLRWWYGSSQYTVCEVYCLMIIRDFILSTIWWFIIKVWITCSLTLFDKITHWHHLKMMKSFLFLIISDLQFFRLIHWFLDRWHLYQSIC
jgi:hypothetical protein